MTRYREDQLRDDLLCQEPRLDYFQESVRLSKSGRHDCRCTGNNYDQPLNR